MTHILQLCCLQGFFPTKIPNWSLPSYSYVPYFYVAEKQHTLLKDGFMPWYRYKLVKNNIPRSREPAFGTLGNETIESGRTPCQPPPALYQLQSFKNSAKVFGNQLPNTTLGIVLAYSLEQSRSQQLAEECWHIDCKCLAQEGRFTSYSKQMRKSLTGIHPSLADEVQQLLRENLFQQQSASTSKEVSHNTSYSTGYAESL